MGVSTVAGIVKSVCEAIWDCLRDHYMPVPDASEWKRIAMDFQTLWSFPNCLGVIHGKHIVIKAPRSNGVLNFNHILAVVDARYRFRVVDIGAHGRNSDWDTLAASFGSTLCQGTLNLPKDAPLPGAEHLGPMPHVFLADKAFQLRRNLLHPYPGRSLAEKRVFNFRLSHARRKVECAFDILASQWRLYRRMLVLSPEVAERVVKATCMLHNYLQWDEGTAAPCGPRETCLGIQDLPKLRRNNASKEAIKVRDQFAQYFTSPAGQVS